MILFKSEIDFKNITMNHFSIDITKEILYDVSVGIFSAMILVWLIDEMSVRNEKREEKKRHLLVCRKLKPILNEYYEFYLKLYIATRKNAVLSNDKVLKSINSCKDQFIQQIREAEPFYKPGFYGDADKFSIQIRMMMNNAGNPEEIMKMDTSLPWYQCWCKDSISFYDGVEQIEKMFIDFFPSDLINDLDELLELVKPLKGMVDFVEMKALAGS